MAKTERYSIIRRLDKGGMAEVFLGKSASLEGFDKVVAIKRVLPDLARNERFVNMFLDEAKISLHLDHANIVSVFDVGRSGQSYFIVMEFIDGTNMKRLIEGHAMPVGLACYVAVEICKALVYAHEKLDSKGQPQHIVHRDISPPNILISRDGEVKLTDFGLAAAASQLESTDPGVVKGKFAYLSPEAAMGEEVDLRADIFALGVVLWESMAGRRLFQGETDLETLQNVRACAVPPIHGVRHDIPASLDRILNRALAKNRADRYGSAREFGRELSSFLVQQGMSVTSYDLAAWIQERIDLPADVSRLSPSLVESAVQEELERFVGVKDDSNVLPDVGGGASSRSRGHTAQFAFEDPRLWGISESEEADDSIQQRFEDSPSGLLRIGGAGEGAFDQSFDDKSQSETGKTLPPRIGRPKRSLPSRGKPPSLPPSVSSKSAEISAPARSAKPRSAPKRTMMMTPLDEAFFDALDSPDTGAASEAEEKSFTRPHRTAGAASTKVKASERARPPASKPAKPAPPPLTLPTAASKDGSTASKVEAKEPTSASSSKTPEPAEVSVSKEIPVSTQHLDEAPKVETPKDDSPAEQTSAGVGKRKDTVVATRAKNPWVSQLVALAAFCAVVYFSYLILAPALM